MSASAPAHGDARSRIDPIMPVPFGVRLAAAWRVDLRGTLAGGLLGLALVGLGIVIAAAALRATGIGPFDIRLNALAEFWLVIAAIDAVVVNADSASARRETALGGWTRRAQTRMLLVKTAIVALVGVLGYGLLVLAAPGINGLLREALGTAATLELGEPRLEPLALVVIGLGLLAAGCAPRLLTMLRRRDRLALVGGVVVLVLLQLLLVDAYTAIAHPGALAGPAADQRAALPVTALALGLSLVVVIGTCLAALCAPIDRRPD
ncbi:MAG: hypothetical protein GXX90_10310 [Microbacteriaceae bacterium]|nr:hypothetical protein [Microbacteriaceae bacterium]